MRSRYFLLFTLMWIGHVHAQSSNPEVLSSAGDTFQGDNVRIEWTLGELAITTIQNPPQQITQGFHQPVYTITSVDELPEGIGQISVFPNPTSDVIEQNLSDRTDISKLPSGNYFLNFFINNQYTQTFKIQKI